MTPLDLELVPEPPSSPAVMAARQRRALVVGLGGGRESDSPMAKSSFAERRLRATDTVSTRYVDPLPGLAAASSATERRGGAASPDRADPPPGGAVSPSLDERRRDGTSPAGVGPLPGVAASVVARERRAGGPSPDDVDPRAGFADSSAPGERRGGGPSTDPSGMSALPTAAGVAPSAAAAASAASMSAALAAASAASGSSGASTSPVAGAPTTAAGLRLDDAFVVPAGALMRGYLRCHALLLVGDVVGNVHCTAGPVVIRSGASLKGRLVANGDVYVCGTVGDTGGGAVITTRGKLTLAPGARVDGDVRSARLDVYDGAVLNGAAKRCED